MPRLIFDEKEIEDQGTSTVNKSGMISIKRKHVGKKVRWIILKKQESDKLATSEVAPTKSTSPL